MPVIDDLIYNNVGLKIIQMVENERAPIYDGPLNTYLYTKHTLRARCTVNQSMIGFFLPGGFQPPFDASAGGINVSPMVTDQAIRDVLSQPRRQLIYTPGGVEVLRSPLTMQTVLNGNGTSSIAGVDAAGGPLPTVYDVREVHGTKTWLVDFGVTTCINEARLFVGQPSVMLSHIFNMAHDVDQDYFTTRTIQGRAVFRSDRLLALAAAPDDFRSFLFHPVPNNFKRSKIRVWMTEDPNELVYQIIDREVPLAIQISGVSRIEAFHSYGMHTASPEDVAFEMSDALNRVGVATAASISPTGAIFESSANVRAIGEAASNLIRTGRNLLPRSFHRITCKVWGQPYSDRNMLELTAINVLMARISPLIRVTYGQDNSVTHDLMGKYVELTADFRGGPIATAFQIGQAFFNNLFGNGNTPNNDSLGNVATTAAYPGMTAPYNAGARGSYIGSLAVQALAVPYAVPSRPGDPPIYTNRTPP